MVFKGYNKHYVVNEFAKDAICNVILKNCLSCKVRNTTFLNYGFCGVNLFGKSYFSNIVMNFTTYSYRGIYLYYEKELQTVHRNECTVVMDELLIYGKNLITFYLTPAIFILFPIHSMKVIISNSSFQNVGQEIIYIDIDSRLYSYRNTIWIKNCNFEGNIHGNKHILSSLIQMKLSYINASLTLSNCNFFGNERDSISIYFVKGHKYKFHINTSCVFASNVTITQLVCIGNKGRSLYLYGFVLSSCKNLIFLQDIDLHNNIINYYYDHIVIYIHNFIVYVNGNMEIFDNVKSTIISFHLSHISFNGNISLTHNIVDNIMIYEFSDILFDGSMIISNNRGSITHMYSSNVTFNGSVDIYDNADCDYIINFQFCNTLFSKNVLITSNLCKQIIVMRSSKELAYIKILEH